ncbi:uncharacterized protein LOC126899264 [Daktulosphaira vitifoliae]|uniref:uncharacterized protein LOC126899264 n=1 Tax=Daktulosphaira vitifoliae TaxID=58002 RepID=UPI0021AA3E05|nr:uncharacterized protein LOC126899264 [Daktulosphaira vitifoliae]
MKLFSLVFFSTVAFMIIHNDHYMSMSKATSNQNESKNRVTLNDLLMLSDNTIEMSGVSGQCDNCKYSTIPVEALYDCKHKYCINCLMKLRQNAYTCEINQCEIEDCNSKLPKGKCLKCNQMKTLDTLFLCRHKHCEDCIKYFIKSKISKCPIKGCNAEVLTEECNYCCKDVLKINCFDKCYHPFCNECSAKFEKNKIRCRICEKKKFEAKMKEIDEEIKTRIHNE